MTWVGLAVHCLGRLLALFTSFFSPLFHTIEMLHVGGVYSVSLFLTPEKDDIYASYFLSFY